jgi:hypothetical protein
VQHRLRSAREHVEAGLDQLRDEHGIDDDLGAGQECRSLSVLRAAEAEDDGRRPTELLGEIRERRDPDPASNQERTLDVEPVPVPERAGRREAERERPRQQPPRRLEHEELPRRAGLEVAALEPQQRVRPDALGIGDPMPTG